MPDTVKRFIENETNGISLEALKNLRLAVLCGGVSPEREVSLMSGKNAFNALESLGFNVKIYDLNKDFFSDAIKGKIDAVLILLHGSPGEDGTVQGFLELCGIPYVGSEIGPSSIGMDKLLTKAVLAANGLPIARYESFCFSGKHHSNVQSASLFSNSFSSLDEFLSLCAEKLPLVVKPARLGSSVGVSIVESKKELEEAVSKVKKYDCCVIVEEYLDAREIQCGIIGRKNPFPLPLIEIIPKRKFFDYEAKYTPGAADEISPAPIDDTLTRIGQELALKTFKIIGCRDFARVDMFLLKSGEFRVSEINTIPGMTENSLVPKEAAALGISYPELIQMIVLPSLVEAYVKKEARG